MRLPIVFDRGKTGEFLLTRRGAILATAGLIMGLTAAVFMPGTVSAHDSDRIRPCSLRTLRGDFGLLASGTARPEGHAAEQPVRALQLPSWNRSLRRIPRRRSCSMTASQMP